MKIRKAKMDDAAGITNVVHSALPSLDAQPIELTGERVKSNLQKAEASSTTTVLVAEDPNGEISGYCAVHWVPFLFFSGGEGYVTELFVRPTSSGAGIGTNLLKEVVTEAKERGCSRLSLVNGRDGESYRRKFYAKRGWVEREKMANFVFPLVSTGSPSTNSAPQS